MLLQGGDVESLRRVAMSYALTEPGLEATLRLAQSELESGRFWGAVSWLRQALEHPDCSGRRAAHAHFMAALAWRHLDRPTEVIAHQQALADMGGEGEVFVRQLQALSDSRDDPAAPQSQAAGVSVLSLAPTPAIDDLVPQAIWTQPMDDSLVRRRFRALSQAEGPEAGLPPAALQERLATGDLATAGVTIAGSVAYVNQGHTVLACDRLTGRELWRYQDFNRMEGLDREGIDALDMNIVSVAPESDCLVTLTGHAQASRRSDGGRVTCLNLSDRAPRRRWSTPLTGVVDAAPDEELFAHGAPVILEGSVYVMARKFSAQMLTAAYVVAIDLESGGVKWARHISSSGGLRQAPRPFDTLLLHEGNLYLASPVGAMARIDPTTGETIWLQRFGVPISPPVMDQTRRPWEMTGPAMIARGMVAIQPDSRRVVLLDHNTGDVLESHSAGSQGDWNAPRYVLSDGADHVYAIGTDVRCFNASNLEAPAWMQPGLVPTTQSPIDQEPPGAPAQPRDERTTHLALDELQLCGRVQMAGDLLIVPTSRGMVSLDSTTGAVHQTLPIDASGNPLALDSQLLMALGDRLEAYMSLSRAEQMLRSQMAQNPADPDPALSMLRLGMRVGNVPLALEAAERALAAIEAAAAGTTEDRRGQARVELFALLLEMARSVPGLTVEQGEAIFARMELAASAQEQRVERLLAYGDWLASRANPAIAQAVEQWQTVLSDPALSSAWRIEDGVMRPAHAAAVQRIGALMASRGANVYAPQADFAAVRLQQISEATLQPPADTAGAAIDSLLALAREFPFADAAIDATLRAAEIQQSLNMPRRALVSLTNTHRLAPRPASAARLLGRAAHLADSAGWPAEAHAMLRTVIEDFGDIELQGDPTTARRRAAQWLNDLEQANPVLARRLPTLGQPAGQVSVLAGPVIPPARSAAPGIMPIDRALVREGNSVSLLTAAGAPEHQTTWSATVDGAAPTVLRFDDRGAVLWLGNDPQDPRAVMLDSRDGTVFWQTPRLTDLLADPARDLNRIRAPREQMPNGDMFDAAQTIALMHEGAIILIRRTGSMIALSAADGKTVLWGPRMSMEQVHLAQARDGALVIAGMARELAGPRPAADDPNAVDRDEQSPGALTPRILVLDPLTGEPAFGDDGIVRAGGRASRESGGVKWMTILPASRGLLVYGAAVGIDAVDLSSGERVWFNRSYAALDVQQAWTLGAAGRMIIEDLRSRLRILDIASGRLSEPFQQSPGADWDVSEFKSMLVDAGSAATGVADAWGHYRQRIVRYDTRSGGVTGADSVTDPQRDYRWAILCNAPAEAIAANGVPQGSGKQRPVAGEGGRRIVVVSVASRQAPMGGGRRTQHVYSVYVFSENGKLLSEPYETPVLPERVQQITAIDGCLLLSTLTSTLVVPMPR
jgi:outer membrane protein assembly factor BamB